jgi:hypothetical protein
VNSLRRVRGPYGFYDAGSVIRDNSYRGYEQNAKRLGLTEEESTFLYKKVLFLDNLGIHSSQGKAVFGEELCAHHPLYRRMPGYTIEDVYLHLNKFVQNRRNQTITRGELEEILLEKVPLDLRPSIQPVQIYTVGPTASDVERDSNATKLVFEWTSFFQNEARDYPPADVWNNQLLGDLRQTKDWIVKYRKIKRVVLSGNHRLSACLAMGFIFSAVSGFAVQMIHRDGIWPTDAHPNDNTPAYPLSQTGSSDDSRGIG